MKIFKNIVKNFWKSVWNFGEILAKCSEILSSKEAGAEVSSSPRNFSFRSSSGPELNLVPKVLQYRFHQKFFSCKNNSGAVCGLSS